MSRTTDHAGIQATGEVLPAPVRQNLLDRHSGIVVDGSRLRRHVKFQIVGTRHTVPGNSGNLVIDMFGAALAQVPCLNQHRRSQDCITHLIMPYAALRPSAAQN